MPYKFFTFNWQRCENGEVVNHDSGFFYTTNDQSEHSKMKEMITKTMLQDADAEILIKDVQEVDKQRFEELTGGRFDLVNETRGLIKSWMFALGFAVARLICK